ncbi:MAG: FAD-dependent oxidoreductase [Halieaceae bacterium]|jgi:NADPH-dependent glutamate synthase beta subunit-like oxidoreductase|nr:FAD-dependent oxidoreductase [Halieaceae bacterium]
MNQPASPLWTTGLSDARKTGTWRSAMPDYRTAPSPCLGACPVDGRIAAWIHQLGEGDYRAAWLTLMDNNPFPAIAGRICHHPCESACNRNELDTAVSICNLERYVGDLALAEGWTIPQSANREESVAVVGGGPAGLSAAYQLRRLGYRVSLLESRDQLGGLMRYGIPAYRLDKSVLDGEIQRILDMDVEVHLNAEVKDCDALRLLRVDHNAVYMATGAARSKRLPNLDYDQPWVIDSADFLAATNAGLACDMGQRLVVIGGGSAAIDVARTAVRLGKQVSMLSLEPDHLLPAQRVEIDEAREEGIEFVTAAMMSSVAVAEGGLEVACIGVKFQPGAKRGEFNVDPIAGSEFTLQADTLIPAIGQDADIERWAELLQSEGPIVSTDDRWQTSAPGVFAGGDLSSMERFVTQAVGMGKQAAQEIDRAINGGQTDVDQTAVGEVSIDAINTYYYPPAERSQESTVSVAQRLKNFDQVQLGFDPQQAAAEAARCFSCGTCIFCDSCYYHCPDMAITKLDLGYEVKTDYCKGCGLCVAECPTGSITMRDEP